MKTNSKRKILSFLLAMLLVVSMLPVKPMTALAAEDVFIGSFDVEFNWDNIPELQVGYEYQDIPIIYHEEIASVEGEGIDPENIIFYWAVKVDDSFYMTTEDDIYIEILEYEGEEAAQGYLNEINQYIDDCIAFMDGWADLDDIANNLGYRVNDSDRYGIMLELYAESGYTFDESGAGDVYQGTVNTSTDTPLVVASFVTPENGFFVHEFGVLGDSPIVRYNVTLDSTNYPADKRILLASYDDQDAWQDEIYENGTLEIREGEYVVVWSQEEVTIAAEGADPVEFLGDFGEEGFAYKITGITANTTIVINPTETPSNTPSNDGTLVKDTAVTTDSPLPGVTFNNTKEELLNNSNIFTDAEKEQIANGVSSKVWLEVGNTDANAVAPEDRAQMELAATQAVGTITNMVYFDASLFKQVGTANAQKVPEPGIGIKISLKLPSDLVVYDPAYSREYVVLRLHNGQVETIRGEFNKETCEFTFVTDKFSTYAIAYLDTVLVYNTPVAETPVVTTPVVNAPVVDAPATDAPADATTPTSPKTSDTGSMFAVVAMMLAAGVMVMQRRKEEK